MTMKPCPSDAQGPVFAMTTVTNDDEAMDLPEHLRALYITQVREGDTDPSNITELKSLLLHHQDTFAKSSTDLGYPSVLQHDINTRDARPIRQQPLRPPIAAQPAEDQILDETLETGVIRPSTSPWASPVCLVKKNYGTYRFCIDYRKLNDVSVSDSYPTPNVQDALDSQGAPNTLLLLTCYLTTGSSYDRQSHGALCILY